ncbi:uncharacterized protein BDR25DRAFT_356136 [Lindgomyces ingoldianus]|uniref:Uncharacterized protein n=1 Tax=Lindgomyces ingoldianus TaxID=673940 RepID=A0ACB6QS89_9PLEO|nr:uncharacterized protein BDR25DRAFT_356136 [Lindgomyces ingoldianus]KAF2469878.1 hypothetical protein BDR25DRAFT_356136 [Lindgomyces ingoldianus]
MVLNGEVKKWTSSSTKLADRDPKMKQYDQAVDQECQNNKDRGILFQEDDSLATLHVTGDQSTPLLTGVVQPFLGAAESCLQNEDVEPSLAMVPTQNDTLKTIHKSVVEETAIQEELDLFIQDGALIIDDTEVIELSLVDSGVDFTVHSGLPRVPLWEYLIKIDESHWERLNESNEVNAAESHLSTPEHRRQLPLDSATMRSYLEKCTASSQKRLMLNCTLLTTEAIRRQGLKRDSALPSHVLSCVNPVPHPRIANMQQWRDFKEKLSEGSLINPSLSPLNSFSADTISLLPQGFKNCQHTLVIRNDDFATYFYVETARTRSSQNLCSIDDTCILISMLGNTKSRRNTSTEQLEDDEAGGRAKLLRSTTARHPTGCFQQNLLVMHSVPPPAGRTAEPKQKYVKEKMPQRFSSVVVMIALHQISAHHSKPFEMLEEPLVVWPYDCVSLKCFEPFHMRMRLLELSSCCRIQHLRLPLPPPLPNTFLFILFSIHELRLTLDYCFVLESAWGRVQETAGGRKRLHLVFCSLWRLLEIKANANGLFSRCGNYVSLRIRLHLEVRRMAVSNYLASQPPHR